MSPPPRRHRPSKGSAGRAPLLLAVALGCAGASSAGGVPAAASPSASDVPSTVSSRSEGDARKAGESAALERLLAAARVDRQIGESGRQLRESMRAGFARQVAAGSLDERHLERIGREVDRAFTDAALRAPMRDALSTTLAPGDIEALLPHYRSALGQRMLEEEATHELSDGGVAFGRFVQAFATDPERDARLERSVAMEAALALADKVGNLQVDLQMAMLAGLSFSVTAETRAELEAMLVALDGQRASQIETLREMMVHYLAFTYESFTLAELDTILAHWRTPAARRFADGTMRGLGEATMATSLAFGERLGRTLSLAEASDEI